jgi:hypothetical protein
MRKDRHVRILWHFPRLRRQAADTPGRRPWHREGVWAEASRWRLAQLQD